MMTLNTSNLITDLKQQGVFLAAEGNKLAVKGASKLTPTQRDTLTSHKQNLIKYLTDEARICELLHRHYCGEFSNAVRKRLEDIFKDNPPDAWERLLTACDYLNIYGHNLEQTAQKALGQ